MNIKIYPSKIKGTITAPPSKSVTHRAIIIASLAHGESIINNALLSEDTMYTINGLKSLGVSIRQKNQTLIIKGNGGNLKAPSEEIFVGNSGSTLRMLTAVSSLASGKTIITGEKRLLARPMGDLLDAIQQRGIRNGGEIKVRGDISSQYISSLLLIAPFAKKTVQITIEGNLRSKPYVALTIALMKIFGVDVTNKNFREFIVPGNQRYIAQNYTIEGDYSSASYFFAAAAVTQRKVTVKNLNTKSIQADSYFLDILEKMGCSVQKNIDSLSVEGSSKLKGVSVDMNDYPDIVQTLSVVAAFAKGDTHITNIGHLKDKETDRISATANELIKMGITVKATNDTLTITGGKPKGATIQTYNDHRMAMSFAIAGLGATGKTSVQQAEVVIKSYPNFWEDLKSIGAKIEINNN